MEPEYVCILHSTMKTNSGIGPFYQQQMLPRRIEEQSSQRATKVGCLKALFWDKVDGTF